MVMTQTITTMVISDSDDSNSNGNVLNWSGISYEDNQPSYEFVPRPEVVQTKESSSKKRLDFFSYWLAFGPTDKYRRYE